MTPIIVVAATVIRFARGPKLQRRCTVGQVNDLRQRMDGSDADGRIGVTFRELLEHAARCATITVIEQATGLCASRAYHHELPLCRLSLGWLSLTDAAAAADCRVSPGSAAQELVTTLTGTQSKPFNYTVY